MAQMADDPMTDDAPKFIMIYLVKFVLVCIIQYNMMLLAIITYSNYGLWIQ